MPKKFNILDHLPPFDEKAKCESCHEKGAWLYSDGHALCAQCTHDDVFDVSKIMNDIYD
jgi:hypothetical protein